MIKFATFMVIVFLCGARTTAAPTDKKIIVIGAGAAGVAAATRLIQNGYTNVKILEAEDRIGGRIHTIRFADNVIDMGAHMCHGEKNNAVFDLAKDHDLLETEGIGGYGNIPLRNSNGSYVDQEVRQKLFDLAFEITYSEDLANYKGSLGNFFFEKYEEKIKEDQYKDIDPKLLKDFPNIFEFLENSLEGTETWFHAAAISPFEESEGDLMLGWKDTGYVTVFDLLQKKIPASSPDKIEISDYTLLGKEVKRIDYSSKPIKVESTDGSVYEADHVISTVSLGVLKDRYLSLFHPFLPEQKVGAIEGLEFGQLGVINFEFEKPFWPANWLGVVPRWLPEQLKEVRESSEEKWLQSLYWVRPAAHKPRVLTGWVSGKYVRDMEKLSPETISRHVIKWLKIFARDLNVPDEPLRTERSGWLKNPHFLGTYSFHSLRTAAFKVTNEDLAKPILDTNGKPLIQFAGEATSTPHFSTVHGAIESGWREADRLIQAANKV